MFSRISLKERLIFTQQLRTMFDSGISILSALMVLEEHAPSSKLRKITKKIIKVIQSGKPLSEALQQQGAAFPNYYIALIRVGETIGTLYQVLGRIEQWLNEQVEYRRKIINISIYPICVLASMGVIPIIIPYLLSPTGPTTDQFARMLGMLILQWGLVIFFIIFGWQFYKKSLYRWPATKLMIQKCISKIPILGTLWRRNALYQLYSLLSTTLYTGLPILSAIPIVIEGTDNMLIRQALFAAQEEIRYGGRMSDALERYQIFPKQDVYMIATGETTGNLAGMIQNLHDTYHTETFFGIKGVLSGMGPILVFIVGLIVMGYILNGFSFLTRIYQTIFRLMP